MTREQAIEYACITCPTCLHYEDGKCRLWLYMPGEKTGDKTFQIGQFCESEECPDFKVREPKE